MNRWKPSVVDRVEYIDQEFIPLLDGSYRWLDLKRFRCSSDASDQELIGRLIAHVRYQDGYTTDDAHWEPTGNLHGPYWLKSVTVDRFEAIDALGAQTEILLWVEQDEGAEGRGFPALVDSAQAIIGSATSLWRLPNMRDHAQHDWGWVLGDFHEIVAIDRARGTLTLMVVSAD